MNQDYNDCRVTDQLFELEIPKGDVVNIELTSKLDKIKQNNMTK